MRAGILTSCPSPHLPGQEARLPDRVSASQLGSWFSRGGAGTLTGWGFSTTQQPSLCQNSLMFPAGSSFTPPPEAPEGSRSAALTARSPPQVSQHLGSQLDGSGERVLGTLSRPVKVSDPERRGRAGPEGGAGGHEAVCSSDAEPWMNGKVNENPLLEKPPDEPVFSSSLLKTLVLYSTLTVPKPKNGSLTLRKRNQDTKGLRSGGCGHQGDQGGRHLR